MKRREFIAAMTGAAGWPLGAHAQQPAMPVIGFFRSGEARASAPLLVAFRSGLKEAGFVEGQNVRIEYRWTNDHRDSLPAFASDLVSRQVAVIVANQEAAIAAKTATSTLPIVFVTGADPVRAGLVTSLNRPEGNVTGIVFTAGDLAGKRLGLLRDLVPTAPVIGVLVDANSPAAEQMLQGVEESRRVLGLRIEIVRPASERELDVGFATMVRAGAGGVLVGSGPFFLGQHQRIIDLAARHTLPASYSTRNYAEAGGLMSYGPNQPDAYRQAGIYVARILRGTKPGELPVEQASKFELVINLKTAKALGLAVPTSMQLLADEVIE